MFILNITEVSNASGVGSLDYAACARTGCAVAGGHGTGPQTTSGSNPSVASQVITPAGTNELIFLEAGYGVGPVYQPSNWFGLIIGTAGASTNDQYCGSGNGYCTNEAQTQAVGRSSAGSYTAQQYDGATNDYYVIQTLAFTAGSSAPVLVSIAVTPANPSIAKGTDRAVHGDGHLQRQQHAESDAQVTWASGRPSDGDHRRGGLATGAAAGTSNITAGLAG